MIIEWNTHIFSADVERYPFHQRAVYTPSLDSLLQDPLGSYKQHMEQEGVERAVLVHPEPYGDDHRLVLDCIDQEPELFKITSLFYPKDEDAPQRLEELVQQQPKIISTRFHAHRGKEFYLDSFADKGVRALWQKAVELGLIVELHIGPDYARQVADALRDYPQTVALIDHLAEPHMGNAVEFVDVLELAKFDQVYMKLSGLNHFAQDAPFYESVRPFTRRVIEAFGPDRLVWGGGSPGIVDIHMEGYSEEDKAKVKGSNLAALLNFT
jgi:predicted TIM-barrel fold metal-dependent hydrolase